MYAGTHRFLGDEVAVKLLRSGLAQDEAAVTAFIAEAERTRAIDHPAVVRVVDFGRDQASGQCYLVMERVNGETLSARIARGALSEAEVRRIGAALADGMQAAHDRGIVHRDLKPANVVLRDGAPIIVDFGIAKALGEESAAQTSRRVGTPPYMAPEQLVSGMITPGVDIWALGAVLFEAATGRRPYVGHDEGRCPQLVETAPRARSLAAVSADLDDLLAHCLEREPGRRPPSMAAIARVLRGEAPAFGDPTDRRTEDLGPIPASPLPTGRIDDAPTTIDPTPRFAPPAPRRRWAAIGLAAALLLAAIAVLAVAASRDRGQPAPEAPSTFSPSPTPPSPSPPASPSASSSPSPSFSPSPPPSPSPSTVAPSPAAEPSPPPTRATRPARKPKRDPRPPAPDPRAGREGLD